MCPQFDSENKCCWVHTPLGQGLARGRLWWAVGGWVVPIEYSANCGPMFQLKLERFAGEAENQDRAE